MVECPRDGGIDAAVSAPLDRAAWCGSGLARATTAVVLADAAGAPLWPSAPAGDIAKPLTPVAGMPAVVRTLRTLWKQGIERAIVVTGCAADEVEAAINRSRAVPSVDIRFVRNAAWPRGNGLSMLAARPLVGQEPVLLTASHLVHCGSILAALRVAAVDEAVALVAVERRLATVRDVDGAVRVRTDRCGRIRALAKGLVEFDGVDTGLALCGPALFDALEQARSHLHGDCSLSDGIRRLAREGRAFAVDVPAHAWWHSLDSVADLRLAEVSATLGVAMVTR